VFELSMTAPGTPIQRGPNTPVSDPSSKSTSSTEPENGPLVIVPSTEKCWPSLRKLSSARDTPTVTFVSSPAP
jgi:hypothetical protein